MGQTRWAAGCGEAPGPDPLRGRWRKVHGPDPLCGGLRRSVWARSAARLV